MYTPMYIGEPDKNKFPMVEPKRNANKKVEEPVVEESIPVTTGGLKLNLASNKGSTISSIPEEKTKKKATARKKKDNVVEVDMNQEVGEESET